MKNIYTQGIIAQKAHFKTLLNKTHIKNQDMRQIIQMAKELGHEVVVLAGRITAKRGCFGIACDENKARLFIATANSRMAELGSTHTEWIFLGDDKFIEDFDHEIVHHAEVSGGQAERIYL